MNFTLFFRAEASIPRYVNFYHENTNFIVFYCTTYDKMVLVNYLCPHFEGDKKP